MRGCINVTLFCSRQFSTALMLLIFCRNRGRGSGATNRGPRLNLFGIQIEDNFWEAKLKVQI